MSSLPLGHRLIFGLRADVADNLNYADDGSIIHPAGHNVILYQNDTKTQRFIPGSPESEGITAMAVSPNRKLLAVAEKAEKAMISVYDLATLKKRKVLLSTEANSKEYVSLSFSADGKTIVAQAGAPEWYLLVWSWEKAKVVATTKTSNQQSAPIYQCSCSPSSDGLVASVVGQALFKTLKLVDSSLKVMPFSPARREVPPPQYACQAWLPETSDVGAKAGEKERQLLGTQEGEVLLVEGAELRATLSCDNGLAVTCLAVHGKGFLAGQDGGVVTVFERDDKEGFRRVRAFAIQGQSGKIRSMSVSPGEEQLAVALDNGQMYTLSLIQQEIMKADDMNFELLTTPNHSSGVAGLALCVRKPLVASCGTDCSVRLWNYNERGAELVRHFQDEALSCALHPSGHLIAVGFADKLRLLSVLLDDLKTVKEVGIKGCREVAFCNGGQLFAAANGTTVSVYNTYTGENVGNLRGHNGKVRSLWWEADDSRLVTAGMDGAVYEWRLADLKREKEAVLKGCAYSCVVASPDGRTLYATGSDRKLKELEEVQGAGTQVVREYDTGVALTQLALAPNTKVMFAGTDTGAVRCYKWPLSGEFTELKLHTGPVSRLRLSGDESLLFTAGEDGAVCVLDVREKDGAKSAAARREVERLPWAEEVLVMRTEMEERKQHAADLETRVAELTIQTEYAQKIQEMKHLERLKEEEDRHKVEVAGERVKYTSLAQEKEKLMSDHDATLKALQAKHSSTMAALEAGWQQRFFQEVERYQSLATAHEAQEDEWRRQNSVLLESHQAALQQLGEEKQADVAAMELDCEALRVQLADKEREAEELRRQLEEDADKEIEELKDKYEQRLQVERASAMKHKSEHAISRKKVSALLKDIESHKAEASEQMQETEVVLARCKALEKEVEHYKKEVKDRDETICEKERRIYDLKKKSQELEKFKFVLEYKNRELKGQIEPREEEISEMRGQIQDMDGELARYHKNNSGLDLLIQNMRMRQAGLQAEVAAQRAEKQSALEAVRRLEHEITAAAAIHDPRQLKEKVALLFQRYCSGAAKGPAADVDVSREYGRQRGYLERTVEGLKHKLAKDSSGAHTEQLRLMSDNCALLREVNELRREVKALRAAAGAGQSAAAARPCPANRKSPANTLSASSRSGSLPRQQSNSRAGQLSAGAAAAAAGALLAATPTSQVASPSAAAVAEEQLVDGLRREVEMQRELIAQLREALAEQQVEQQEQQQQGVDGDDAAGLVRPISRERLTPIGAQ